MDGESGKTWWLRRRSKTSSERWMGAVARHGGCGEEVRDQVRDGWGQWRDMVAAEKK